MVALRQAIAGGQYVNAKGLFFGGKQLEPGPSKFQAYIAERFAGAERVVAVDVHTGLGPFGDDRLLTEATRPVYPALEAAYGERVQPLKAEESVAYEVRGHQGLMYYRLFPSAQIYFATQEFGTYHSMRVLAALRAENRCHHYGSGAVDHPTKKALREMFNPNHQKWRTAVLKRGEEVVHQALALLLGEAGGRR